MGHSPKEKPNRNQSPNHTDYAAELPSPCCPWVFLVSAHTNKSMIIAKESTTQQNTQQQKQGKPEHTKSLHQESQIHIHSPSYIRHTSILRPSKQYTTTRLIRIHITWSDSADACACGGYLCSPPNYVLRCYNKSISLTTRLALRRFQASYYSHHRSQSALGETN